jgi:hypothetical protein
MHCITYLWRSQLCYMYNPVFLNTQYISLYIKLLVYFIVECVIWRICWFSACYLFLILSISLTRIWNEHERNTRKYRSIEALFYLRLQKVVVISFSAFLSSCIKKEIKQESKLTPIWNLQNRQNSSSSKISTHFFIPSYFSFTSEMKET